MNSFWVDEEELEQILLNVHALSNISLILF